MEKAEEAPRMKTDRGLETCREWRLIRLVINFEEVLNFQKVSVQCFSPKEIYPGMACHNLIPELGRQRRREAEQRGKALSMGYTARYCQR